MTRELVQVQQATEMEYVPLLVTMSLKGYAQLDNKLNALSTDQKLAKTWEMMMRRCYIEQADDYHIYGGAGVSVCKRWQNLETFISDVKNLVNWQWKVDDWGGWQLDKDYYGSNQYNPETCVWVSRADNMAYTGHPVRVANCFGVVKMYVSIVEAARCFKTNDRTIKRFTSLGKITPRLNLGCLAKQYIGWTFELIRNELWRYKL